MTKAPNWTTEEDEVLRVAYANGLEAAQKALPNRTLRAIFKRACRLGCTRRPFWTEAEDKRLSLLWGDGKSVEQIAREIGRPVQGVYWRATRVLGLKGGCPQGYEYLYHAAQRVGYAKETLRKIMRWAGLPIHRSLYPGADSHCIVDSGDVDDAVAKWMKTEPCSTAARRVGVPDWLLRRRLARMGLRGKRRHLRVTEKQVQAALEAA